MELWCGVAQLRFVRRYCLVNQTARRVLGIKARLCELKQIEPMFAIHDCRESIIVQGLVDLDVDGFAEAPPLE